jgi:hypothetical protein
MQVVLSDISGEEIVKHQEPTDSQVIVGGVIFHATRKEQEGLVRYIGWLQDRRMPKQYRGEFEPYTDGRQIIREYRDRVANHKAMNPIDDLFE